MVCRIIVKLFICFSSQKATTAIWLSVDLVTRFCLLRWDTMPVRILSLMTLKKSKEKYIKVEKYFCVNKYTSFIQNFVEPLDFVLLMMWNLSNNWSFCWSVKVTFMCRHMYLLVTDLLLTFCLVGISSAVFITCELNTLLLWFINHFPCPPAADISYPQSWGWSVWDASHLPGPRPSFGHQWCGVSFWADRWVRWYWGFYNLPESREQLGGGGQWPLLCRHLCELWVSGHWSAEPWVTRPVWRWSPTELFSFGEYCSNLPTLCYTHCYFSINL